MQPFLEDTVSEGQKEAIFYILSGEDQPAGTMFQIFSVIVEHFHDPILGKIEFDVDVKRRSARIEVPDLLRTRRLGIPRGGGRRRLRQEHRRAEVRPSATVTARWRMSPGGRTA